MLVELRGPPIWRLVSKPSTLLNLDALKPDEDKNYRCPLVLELEFYHVT